MRRHLLVVSLLAHLLATACSDSGSDTDPEECRAALAHAIEVQTRPPDDADEQTRAELAAHRSNLGGGIDATAIAACQARSDAWRHCLLAAADIDALHACRQGDE